MDNTFIKKILYEFGGLKFLIRNLKASHQLEKMQSSSLNNYILAGLSKDRIYELDQLHQLIRDGRDLNFWRKFLYRYRGNKLCAIAINQKNQLAGFIYFYFREEEISKNIIHEAFVGVAPQERGKGIATALQKYSLTHLSHQHLEGVSGYVEKNNIASVIVHQRVGYEIDDDPQDPENNYFLYYRLM